MHPAHKDIALVAALGRIRPPDHLCSIYETADEQHAVVMPFMRLGLERGEKCIYLADAGAEELIRSGRLRPRTGAGPPRTYWNACIRKTPRPRIEADLRRSMSEGAG